MPKTDCPFAGMPFCRAALFAGLSLWGKNHFAYFWKRSSLALRTSPLVVPGTWHFGSNSCMRALWEIFKAAACLTVQATINLFPVPGPGTCCMYAWFLPPPTVKEAVWMLVVAPPANLAIFGLCLEAGLLHVLAANAIFVAGFFSKAFLPSPSTPLLPQEAGYSSSCPWCHSLRSHLPHC